MQLQHKVVRATCPVLTPIHPPTPPPPPSPRALSRAVVLAAMPPAARWSPSRHRSFPPAFKQAARQLLLVNNRLRAGQPASWGTADAGRQAALVKSSSSTAGAASIAGGAAGEGGIAAGSLVGGEAAPRGLPRDAVHEVLRQLASFPLSFWMKQPAAADFPPAATSRTPATTASSPFLPGPLTPDAPHTPAAATPPLPALHPVNPQPAVPAGSIPVPEGPGGAA